MAHVATPGQPSDNGTSVGSNGTVAAPNNTAVATDAAAGTGQGPNNDKVSGKPVAKVATSIESLKAARRTLFGTDGTKTAGTGDTAGTVSDKDGADKAGGSDGPGKLPEKADQDQTLTQFVSLRRDLETAKKQYKEAEPILELGNKLKQAQVLADEGKHWDAIQLLHPEWFDKAAKQVMNIEETPESKALSEIKARQDKLDADIKAQADAKTKADAEAEREQGRVAVRKFVVDNKEKFPLLSKSPTWIDKALAGADDAYPKVVKELGRELSNDEKTKLIETALATGEKYRQEQRKLYEPEPAPVPTDDGKSPSATFRGDMRAGTQGRPVVAQKLTLEQLKARRRANA